MNRNLSRRRTAFSLALAMLALACMVPFAIGVFAAEGGSRLCRTWLCG